MVLSKQQLTLLKDNFRLNIYEIKIWTSLLSRGISSAAELADISGVPRSRCYDVLETLEKKGFVIMKIGRPIKYIAIPPNDVFNRVKKEITNETSRVIETTNELKKSETFKELELLYKTGITHIDPLKIATSITGKANINIQIRTLFEKAKSKISLHIESDSIKRSNNLKSLIKKTKKLGIKTTVYTNDKKIKDQFKEYCSVILCRTNLRFVIMDQKEVLFFTTDPMINPTYENAVWIDSPFIVKQFDSIIQKNLKP
ncbi:TrmB family transcriptional regulator [Nanoarchaeota archaeon]